MARSRSGDQISAHISKSANMGDMRHLIQIVYEIADADRKTDFETHIKSAYSQDDCGYWHAAPNMIFVKIPGSNEGNTACSVHYKLMPRLNKESDRLVVMGPLWEVDTDDWGLEITDVVNFGRTLV